MLIKFYKPKWKYKIIWLRAIKFNKKEKKGFILRHLNAGIIPMRNRLFQGQQSKSKKIIDIKIFLVYF